MITLSPCIRTFGVLHTYPDTGVEYSFGLFLLGFCQNLLLDKQKRLHTFLFYNQPFFAAGKDDILRMSNDIYYRPTWTCGRCNVEKQATIYYNLITGISYYFEDFSAMVIGELLKVPRNGRIKLQNVSAFLNISMESLVPFFIQLEQLGLVSLTPVTENIVAEYRKRVSEYNRIQQQAAPRSTQEKLPYDTSNAEMLYTDKVGGITSIMFELTYNCSEKCIHCYNIGATRNDDEKSTRGNRSELTLDDYKRIIDELYELGLIKVCLTGGDPFSKPIVWDIIEYLYNKEIAFDIYTNGHSIVNKTRKLADYYPRLIGISIYSGVPEVHDYITRIKGSWDRSMIVARELSALAVPMNLKCCVMRPNVKTYYMVADIAQELGAVPQFEVSLTDSIEGDKCVSKFLRLTDKELEIVLRDDNVPLYVGKEAPNYGGQPKLMDSNPCGAGSNSFCVTPEGNLIPCCAFHTIFGNLIEQTIADILLNCKELSYWRGLTLNDYEECGRLDYCAYCNLCPGNNFVEHGTPLEASENNCRMAKIRFGLAHKMMADGYDPLNDKSLKGRLSELPDYTPVRIHKEMSHNFSDIKLKLNG